MSKLNERLKKCFKEGESGGRKHKGIRKITPNKELSLAHLNKALHNFEAITTFYKTGFSDWSASAAFYTLYQCLLGILAKNGYESKNQSCTFALAEDLIDKNKIKEITKDDLKEISDIYLKEETGKIIDIREDMQYTIKTEMEHALYIKLKEKTKILFEKLKLELQR